MAEFLLQKMPGGQLIAADDETAAAIGKVKTGAVLRAKVTQMRNYEFHKKWFSLVLFAFDVWQETCPRLEYKGQPVQPNLERFRKDLTILAGHYDPVFDMRGELRLQAHSISFANMSQEDFEKLYSETIDAILGKVLASTKITREDVDRHVERVMQFDSH